MMKQNVTIVYIVVEQVTIVSIIKTGAHKLNYYKNLTTIIIYQNDVTIKSCEQGEMHVDAYKFNLKFKLTLYSSALLMNFKKVVLS